MLGCVSSFSGLQSPHRRRQGLTSFEILARPRCAYSDLHFRLHSPRRPPADDLRGWLAVTFDWTARCLFFAWRRGSRSRGATIVPELWRRLGRGRVRLPAHPEEPQCDEPGSSTVRGGKYAHPSRGPPSVPRKREA